MRWETLVRTELSNMRRPYINWKLKNISGFILVTIRSKFDQNDIILYHPKTIYTSQVIPERNSVVQKKYELTSHFFGGTSSWNQDLEVETLRDWAQKNMKNSIHVARVRNSAPSFSKLLYIQQGITLSWRRMVKITMAVVDNQEVTRIARTSHICHKLSNYHTANVVSTQLSLLSLNLQQSIKTAAVPDEILRIQDNRCTSTPNSPV